MTWSFRVVPVLGAVVVTVLSAGMAAVALEPDTASVEVRAAGSQASDGSDPSPLDLDLPALPVLPEPTVPVTLPTLLKLPSVTLPALTVPTAAPAPPSEPLQTNGTYLAHADGSRLVRIGDSSDFASVRFSPDGRRLAFLRNQQVWVSATDGSNGAPISGGERACCHLDWSPDGAEIAYEVPGPGITTRILGIAPDGGAGRVLVEDGAMPRWAPAGGRLLFTNGVWNLHVREPDGSVHRIASVQSEPAWSPDGRRILAAGVDPDTAKPATWIFEADGSGRQRLDAAGEFSRHFLTWSPDGSFITWGGGLPTPESERRTVVARPDGSVVRDLGVGSTAPLWLPHGDQLVVHRDFGGADVVNADGSGRRPFLDATLPYTVGSFAASGGWVLLYTL